MADIYYRNRGTKAKPNWQYRFEGAPVGGKRKEISKSGFKTKAEAVSAGTKAYNEYKSSGQVFRDSNLSYSDFLDYWIEEYCVINLKSTTVEGYKKKVRLYIKPYLGMYQLTALTPAALQSFINDRFNDGLSRNTLSVIKGIVSKSLTYAVTTMRLLQFNPMDCVSLPAPRAKAKVPTRKKERDIVTPEQLAQIFERFPEGHPAYLPLLLAYRCGMRLGEVFALTWADISFKTRKIDINKQVQMIEATKFWTFVPPKYDSYRVIDMDDTVVAALKREAERQRKAQNFYAEFYHWNYIDKDNQLNSNASEGSVVRLIMVRENGTYITPRTMQHVGRVIHGKANGTEKAISENWDFHSLRHTHATMLLEAGVPMAVIQERLGHTNIDMTEHYTSHITNSMRENLTDVLNKIAN